MVMKPRIAVAIAACLLLLPLLARAERVIRDDLGTRHFARVPQRVISLSWESTEQLLELGITPLGAADTDSYRQWVVQPALPASTRAVGSRLEPNLELLAALKPDLIIINPTLQSMRPQLMRIAPVLLFDAYRNDHDNASKALSVYLQLASLFDRKARAQARLQQLARQFAQLRSRLRQHWPHGVPPVQVVRFAGPTVANVYGSNSMPVHALQCLGLRPASGSPGFAWGMTATPVMAMGSWQQDIVLHQLPFDQAGKLFPSPVWQAMPFVRAQRFAAVRSTWSYGGLFSLYYLGQAMTDALLGLPASSAAAQAVREPDARACALAAY
jgi:ABC-type Fe3+-hydroxamate transport system substrate-binding protein